MLTNGEKFNRDTRKTVLCVLLILLCCSSLFAQSSSTPELVDNWSNKLINFIGSGWVKAVALLALVVEAIGIVVGGQQGGGGAVFKKLAPWIVGTILLLMASSICNYMYEGVSFSLGN